MACPAPHARHRTRHRTHGDLARKLDALLERPEELEAARAGAEALAARFAFDDQVRRLEKLYERVARPLRGAGGGG